MNIAFLIGRLILGAYWLMGGFNHFKNLDSMSEYAKAKGTPFPKLAVAGTGVVLLAGGLSMLLGVYTKVGDRSAGHLPRGCLFPNPQLLEDGRRANEAGRHDQFHEEHGAGGGTLDAAASPRAMAHKFENQVGRVTTLDRAGKFAFCRQRTDQE